MTTQSLAILAEFEIPVRGVSSVSPVGHLSEALRNQETRKYMSNMEANLHLAGCFHSASSNSCVGGVLTFDHWRVAFIPATNSKDAEGVETTEFSRRLMLCAMFSTAPSIYKMRYQGQPGTIPLAKIQFIVVIDKSHAVTKYDPITDSWCPFTESNIFSIQQSLAPSIQPKTPVRIIFFCTDFSVFAFRCIKSRDTNLNHNSHNSKDKDGIKLFMRRLVNRLHQVRTSNILQFALDSTNKPYSDPIDRFPYIYSIDPFKTYDPDFKDDFTSTDHNPNPVAVLERVKACWFLPKQGVGSAMDYTECTLTMNRDFELCKSLPLYFLSMMVFNSKGCVRDIKNLTAEFAGSRLPVLSATYPKYNAPRLLSDKSESVLVYLFRCGELVRVSDRKASPNTQLLGPIGPESQTENGFDRARSRIHVSITESSSSVVTLLESLRKSSDGSPPSCSGLKVEASKCEFLFGPCLISVARFSRFSAILTPEKNPDEPFIEKLEASKTTPVESEVIRNPLLEDGLSLQVPALSNLKRSFDALTALIRIPQTKISGSVQMTTEQKFEMKVSDMLDTMPDAYNLDPILSKTPDSLELDDASSNEPDNDDRISVNSLNFRRDSTTSVLTQAKSKLLGSSFDSEKRPKKQIVGARAKGSINSAPPRTLDEVAAQKAVHRSDWLGYFASTEWLSYVSLALHHALQLAQLIIEVDASLKMRLVMAHKENIDLRGKEQSPQMSGDRRMVKVRNYAARPPGKTCDEMTLLVTGPHKETTGTITYSTDVRLLVSGPGTGRTWQAVVVSLAQLILQSETRTLDGFEDLIEREWVRYGYPFAPEPSFLDQKVQPEYEEGASFVLFLDAVHQLLYQNPASFAFTADYLVILMDCALSRGGGLPPFSLEFAASCEAARCPIPPGMTFPSTRAQPNSNVMGGLRGKNTIRFFRNWQSNLTSLGLSLIPNWLFYEDSCRPHSGNRRELVQMRLSKKEQVLMLSVEPIAVLQFWHAGYMRWARQMRIGGFAGAAAEAALIRKYFGGKDKAFSELIQSSTFPYSGWLSDESIDVAYKLNTNSDKYELVENQFTAWFQNEPYLLKARKLADTWTLKG
ncbi:Myotubularin- protein 10 [Cichlidogyrus casuarinus]|uniref:Myotubularin- protein 10 n=1 Tax=Cichlidogyrus casuarinus TaxID=1844966 RepID=A0ABD2PQ79_9PLAT